MKIELKEKDINDLMEFINELPTKYGIPLIEFLNKKIEEQKDNEDK